MVLFQSILLFFVVTGLTLIFYVYKMQTLIFQDFVLPSALQLLILEPLCWLVQRYEKEFLLKNVFYLVWRAKANTKLFA